MFKEFAYATIFLPIAGEIFCMPKVSVIMPTYNVEQYFEQCINSIVNQTLKDIEIIPVDDGSPDNCGKIMDEYAKNDSRIKPIHQKNGGYGRAVNAGLEAASGEYVAIVETDDWCEPDMFEKLYNQAVTFGADVCKCGFNFYLGDNKFKKCTSIKEVAKEGEVFTLKDNPKIMKPHVSIWAAIYRRDYLNENNIRVVESAGASYQDMPFAALVYAKGGKITVLHDCLINYRVEDGMSSSTMRNDGKLAQMPVMCMLAKKYFMENGCWDEVKEVAYRHFFNCSFAMWCRTSDEYKKAHFDELYKLFGNIPNENVKLSCFKSKHKKMLKLIIENQFDKLLEANKNYSLYAKLKKLRQNIISIRFNKNDRSIILFAKNLLG